MYLIITPTNEYKAKRWNEVITFFERWTFIDLPFKGCPKNESLTFGGGYQILHQDGRALKEINYLPI